MGFKIPDTVVLTFDGAFEGLEIRCRLGLPIREQLEIRELTRDLPEDDPESFLAVFRAWFERVRLTWNVETDDGQAVPITVDAVMNYLPGDILIQLLPKWREAMGVSAPLGVPSNSGEASQAPRTPTLASLSESLAS